MKNHEYNYSVYLVTSGMATSGHLEDIAPGQLGIYSRNNYHVVSNPALREEIFFAFGSTRKTDTIGLQSGYKATQRDYFFKPKDIVNFEISDPVKETKSNKISVGFSGGSCSNGIKFECDTNYVLKLVLTGSPILRYMGKPLEKVISYNTGCCPSADCTSCPDSTVDCEKHTKAIVDLINNEVELKQLGGKAMFISNKYAAPTPNMKKYCIEVCDNGDTASLQTVQAIVKNLGKVEKSGRKDCKTKYTYCGEKIASDFIPSVEVPLAVCGTCQSGYTLVPQSQLVTVVQPIESTTNTSTDAAKKTLADAIAGSYSGTDAVFNSVNGATVSVSFKVPVGTVVTPLLSDQVIIGMTVDAVCKPVAPSPISWVECGTAYKTKRKLEITLRRKDCNGADRLAELTAFYANNPEVVSNSLVKLPGSVSCEDCYEIEQWSKGCMSDECLASDSPVFENLSSFEGTLWKVKEEPTVLDATKKCGFTIEFNLPETVFSNCSFNVDDFYENDPVHLEAAWELNYPNVCDLKNLPVIKEIRGHSYRRQSGEWVIRELIKASAYNTDSQFYNDARLREVFGQEILNLVDRNAFYKVYYMKYVESRAGVNTFSEQPRVFEPLFIVKETDNSIAVQLEQKLGQIASVNGIVLNKREDLNW